MARKGLLSAVMGDQTGQEAPATENRSSYALKGASRNMKASIDSLAEDAKKLMEGETIVEIDPQLIDGSFVADRLDSDAQEYDELKQSIASGRQETPVLLRPHPEDANRYMIVFGHRRVRVAMELGRTVRAVVKDIDHEAHVLAQGQENTARADLSFIEKAMFAKRLADLQFDKEVIQSALTVDATLLSRMLSVSQKIAPQIIEAIGAAKSVGRDRWEEFKKLAIVPDNTRRLMEIIQTPEFTALDTDKRFERLLRELKTSGNASHRTKPKPQKETWTAGEGRIKGVIGRSGKAFNISLTAEDAGGFGEYLSKNLDQLYNEFSRNRTRSEK
ncbi:MAG: plasmid partitioning protein RepB [Pseudomonadota bacterium]